ncbi:hypothetical protein QBC47DRAFT_463927 [Echria macrotheca]|uniref:Uncharacterized protein n=1 Tax=Echria macrotheca TaxID=438768 RepID=A0AAJ0B538_9PEZI|nr:hypothetical protein QBC47DRAFT_463927 [Echria macrotheca]
MQVPSCPVDPSSNWSRGASRVGHNHNAVPKQASAGRRCDENDSTSCLVAWAVVVRRCGDILDSWYWEWASVRWENKQRSARQKSGSPSKLGPRADPQAFARELRPNAGVYGTSSEGCFNRGPSTQPQTRLWEHDSNPVALWHRFWATKSVASNGRVPRRHNAKASVYTSVDLRLCQGPDAEDIRRAKRPRSANRAKEAAPKSGGEASGPGPEQRWGSGPSGCPARHLPRILPSTFSCVSYSNRAHDGCFSPSDPFAIG